MPFSSQKRNRASTPRFCMYKMNETVTFNVGGTVHKISRSLLEMHPQTMLAKSASELWYDMHGMSKRGDKNQKEQEKSDIDTLVEDPVGLDTSSTLSSKAEDREIELKIETELGMENDAPLNEGEEYSIEIFIDRDGSLFRHVLNYLRDGKITIPVTVAKSAIMRELEYYGVDADVSSVEICTQATARGALSINRLIQSLEQEEQCVRFARICIDRYKNKARDNEFQFFMRHDCADKGDYEACEAVCSGGDAMIERCNRHLMKFGLDLRSICLVEVLRQRPKYSVLVEVIDVNGDTAFL